MEEVARMPRSTRFLDLQLAVEEACCNVIEHAYDGQAANSPSGLPAGPTWSSRCMIMAAHAQRDCPARSDPAAGAAAHRRFGAVHHLSLMSDLPTEDGNTLVMVKRNAILVGRGEWLRPAHRNAAAPTAGAIAGLCAATPSCHADRDWLRHRAGAVDEDVVRVHLPAYRAHCPTDNFQLGLRGGPLLHQGVGATAPAPAPGDLPAHAGPGYHRLAGRTASRCCE